MTGSGEVARRGRGRPPRTEEEAERTRRRIVEAAERTFARDGYPASPVSAVREEALDTVVALLSRKHPDAEWPAPSRISP